MLPTVPDAMLERLKDQYGNKTTDEIVRGLMRVRPVTLRVNTLKASREEISGQLDALGIAWEAVPWYADALILPGVREGALQALPMYENGSIYLQSLSAMVPALALGAKAGESVLDMAAAPGGKTTQIAALTGGGALITACEKNKIRADRLKFNLERQGAGRCMVMNSDARQLDPLFSFDRILLDAPCTGSGTLLLTEGQPQRRMDEGWIAKTAATQFAMLRKASQLLKKGHEVVYSTCSILREENEDVVERACRECALQVVPVEETLAHALPLLETRVPGTLVIHPTALYEGFFVAKLRKVK